MITFFATTMENNQYTQVDINSCTFAEYKTWVFENYLLGTGNRISSALNEQISVKLPKTGKRKPRKKNRPRGKFTTK